MAGCARSVMEDGGKQSGGGAGRREKARVIMREQDVLRYGEEAKDRSGGCMEMALCEHGGATMWFNLARVLFIIAASGFVCSTMCGFSFL